MKAVFHQLSRCETKNCASFAMHTQCTFAGSRGMITTLSGYAAFLDSVQANSGLDGYAEQDT